MSDSSRTRSCTCPASRNSTFFLAPSSPRSPLAPVSPLFRCARMSYSEKSSQVRPAAADATRAGRVGRARHEHVVERSDLLFFYVARLGPIATLLVARPRVVLYDTVPGCTAEPSLPRLERLEVDDRLPAPLRVGMPLAPPSRSRRGAEPARSSWPHTRASSARCARAGPRHLVERSERLLPLLLQVLLGAAAPASYALARVRAYTTRCLLAHEPSPLVLPCLAQRRARPRLAPSPSLSSVARAEHPPFPRSSPTASLALPRLAQLFVGPPNWHSLPPEPRRAPPAPSDPPSPSTFHRGLSRRLATPHAALLAKCLFPADPSARIVERDMV